MSTQLITNELTFETANELANQKFKEQNILIEESEKLEAEKKYDSLAKNLDKIADLKLEIWQLIAFQKGWKAGQNNKD